MNRWLLRLALGALFAIAVHASLGEDAHAQPQPGMATGEGGAAQTELEKKAASYPFRGSSFAWWQSLSALALNPGAELTYNPSFNWTFRFWPRWNIDDKWSVRLKMDLNVELTNADDTTKQRETQLGDTWLDLVYGSFKEKNTGIIFSPSLRFILPTSKQSQARSLYTVIAPGFLLSRGFKLGPVDVDVSYFFRYGKHLNKYTTVQFDAPGIACTSGSGDCGQFLHTGGRNTSHDFWNFLFIDFGWTTKLRSSFVVGVYNALLYDLSPATATLAGGARVPIGNSGNGTNMRGAMYYYVDIGYQFHPTVSVGVGLSTFNAQLADDSTYRAPFFNRFTEIMLSTTVSLDALVALFDRRKTK